MYPWNEKRSKKGTFRKQNIKCFWKLKWQQKLKLQQKDLKIKVNLSKGRIKVKTYEI